MIPLRKDVKVYEATQFVFNGDGNTVALTDTNRYLSRSFREMFSDIVQPIVGQTRGFSFICRGDAQFQRVKESLIEEFETIGLIEGKHFHVAKVLSHDFSSAYKRRFEKSEQRQFKQSEQRKFQKSENRTFKKADERGFSKAATHHTLDPHMVDFIKSHITGEMRLHISNGAFDEEKTKVLRDLALA